MRGERCTMARRPSIERVYQLDIRLERIEPPIWRRIVVSDQITLASLHHLLQVVMEWEHSHLHQVLGGTARDGAPDPDYDDDIQSDHGVRLRDIARENGASCRDESDYADGWRQ